MYFFFTIIITDIHHHKGCQIRNRGRSRISCVPSSQGTQGLQRCIFTKDDNDDDDDDDDGGDNNDDDDDNV